MNWYTYQCYFHFKNKTLSKASMSQMNIWHEFIYLLENFCIVLRNNNIYNNPIKKLNEPDTIFRIMVTQQWGE